MYTTVVKFNTVKLEENAILKQWYVNFHGHIVQLITSVELFYSRYESYKEFSIENTEFTSIDNVHKTHFWASGTDQSTSRIRFIQS